MQNNIPNICLEITNLIQENVFFGTGNGPVMANGRRKTDNKNAIDTLDYKI